MKYHLSILSAFLLAGAVAQAGPALDKSVTAPSTDIGSGFYVGLQGGASLYQSGIPASAMGAGTDSHKKVGWEAGLKAGYVFGDAQQLVRPAVEAEGLYSAFNRNFSNIGGDEDATAKLKFRTFSYLLNGIAKFNLGSFQPYVGAGAGFFSMKGKAKMYNAGTLLGSGSDTRDGFAWQLLGGADYYFTPKVSVFSEYKWLNYQIRNSDDFTGRSRISEQLLAMGVRYHF